MQQPGNVKALRAFIANPNLSPRLLCEIYCYLGHVQSDKQLYRTKEEVGEWKQRDAIERFAPHFSAGILTENEARDLQARAERVIGDAIAYGEAGPEPPVGHLTGDVYV